MTKILPFVMITINIFTAIIYAINGDIRRTVYWIAAAVLTLSVTI